MGTWGHGSFDNDGAHDWLDELHDKGLAAIRGVLGRVARAKATAYVDADDAQAAIAAAEVVAASRGHARSGRQPDLLAVWIDEHAAKIKDEHATLGAKAVTRVRERSELQELWDDDRKWTRGIDDLLKRLAAKPKRVRARGAGRALPVDEPPSVSVQSPNRKLTATVVGNSPKSCYVMIDVRDEGGSVFSAACKYDAVVLRWIDNATLVIRYPKSALVDQRDPIWQLGKRRVACVYRPNAPRKKSTTSA